MVAYIQVVSSDDIYKGSMIKVFQDFIDKLIPIMQLDSRFCGLAIAGSWISKEIDSYSDLDLVLVTSDQEYESVFQQRLHFISNLDGFLSAFPGDHVGVPSLMICLFKNPLIHVDIKFVAVKDFHLRIEDPIIAWQRDSKLIQSLQLSPAQEIKVDYQWIENRFWTWIHYGALKLGRGELFETINFLGFLRERVLGPMILEQVNKPARGVRRIEKYAPEYVEKLQKAVAVYNFQSCYEALDNTATLYKELRGLVREKNIILHQSAETAAMQFLRNIKIG